MVNYMCMDLFQILFVDEYPESLTTKSQPINVRLFSALQVEI